MNPDKVKLRIINRFVSAAQSHEKAEALLRCIIVELGYEEDYFEVLFPAGLVDVLNSILSLRFYAFAEHLDKEDLCSMKVRERIKFLLMGLFAELRDSKVAIRSILCGSIGDLRMFIANLKVSWEIVDEMWHLAGDESTDFNFYTKRILLFSVFVPSVIYWLKEDSDVALDKFVTQLLLRVNKLGKFKGFVQERMQSSLLCKVFARFF
jgi:ubiquinone biosynthesis protein COQ9